MANRQKHDSVEERLARAIDDLAEFEDFKAALLPKLRQMIREGWSADKIRREVGPYIAARIAGMALLGNIKSASTLKAAQDTMDRLEGRAVQRVEQKTIYAQMSRKELAALAWQKLIDAGIIGPDGRVLKKNHAGRSASFRSRSKGWRMTRSSRTSRKNRS